ncbi:aminotransferase class IV [Candidatus Parcubacteria bacterium]|nr:aminotransferase class IV [Candidatus Parcubacteria bacterium]
MMNFCYFNNQITTLDKIKISPYDIGILRGYGVFDVMCTQNQKAFLMDEHWKRFQDSADTLDLQIPISFEEYKKVIKELIVKNGFQKSTIRTILTGGKSSNAFTPEGNETFYILIEKAIDLPQEIYKQGASVITLNYKRTLPHAKITNYIMAIKHQKEKEKNNALEIIYTKNNQALEATTSNFFNVKNENVITTNKEILHGVTKNLVIKLAKKNKISVEEKDITIDELFNADEVFLTASNKNIVPIVEIDNKKIQDGKVGKTTKKLMKLFSNFAEKY